MDIETKQHEVVVEVGRYEPPAVETVLTADELAREIQYAGDPSVA